MDAQKKSELDATMRQDFAEISRLQDSIDRLIGERIIADGENKYLRKRVGDLLHDLEVQHAIMAKCRARESRYLGEIVELKKALYEKMEDGLPSGI